MDDIKFTTAGDMVGTESRVLVTATVEFVLHRSLLGSGINDGNVVEWIREALEDRITGVSERDRSSVQSLKIKTF